MQQIALPGWLAWLYTILFALLPWSVECSIGPGWSLDVPSEPLIGAAGIGLLTVLLRQRTLPWHRLMWIPGMWMGWQLVAVFFSTMPLVSAKYVLVESAHWVVFFYGLALWPALWPRLIRVFAYSLACVTVYALMHHGYYHFRADQAILAPMPFFSDHTVYSVVLVLVLLVWGVPQVLGVEPAFLSPASGQAPKQSLSFRDLTFGALLRRMAIPALFVLALVLIVSRAAWLSLFVATFVGTALYFRRYWPVFLLLGVSGAGLGYVFHEKISARLSADVSSMERLNRYSCARRMALDRPWTGFGPGTFQFQYLPYQHPEEMTRLSITEPIAHREFGQFGRGGGAHSEYLQALAETGWLGLVLLLFLTVGSVALGFRAYWRSGHLYWLFLTLGLLSFWVHGAVNNFWHDAGAAGVVWGAVGLVGKRGGKDT